MNYDKVQHLSGYQRWYLSSNRYITSHGDTKNISISTSGQISMVTHHIEKIHNQIVMEFYIYCHINKCICCEIWNVSGSHTSYF